MKKRLRKKLGRGEYANPMRYTRAERAAKAHTYQVLMAALHSPMGEAIMAAVRQRNEAHLPQPQL
jgi:hypothetical protein